MADLLGMNTVFQYEKAILVRPRSFLYAG